MSSFVCPLCQNSREFTTFGKFFHHITIFHQNEHNFHITCELNSSCGVCYRTYAAYKGHVYRHHANELHMSEEKNVYLLSTNNNQHLNMDSNIDLNSMNHNLIINANDNDDNDLLIDSSEACALNNNQQTTSTDPQNLLKLPFNEESNLTFLSEIQKSFTYFMLQLREEFCLPKTTIKSISNYIVTLINNIESILEQQAIGFDASNTTKISSKTTSEVNKDFIELRIVRRTMKEVCHAVEAVTHNEYQFLKYCEKYFKYNSPQEVIVSAPGEKLQYSYFVPIDQTLISMLHNQETVDQILNNIKQQQEAVVKDEDIMFSFRDSNYGSRIDDDSMLIQLYADEIGLTNPIGAKKDRHKMVMIYFSLEDIPDQHRSQLDQIHLVALCESVVIKVKSLMLRIVGEFHLFY
ncbi:unnamed protein product [Rotaria sp. Silwood1]|nr:unnamed protein product [Rotaria sp. Silwood1]